MDHSHVIAMKTNSLGVKINGNESCKSIDFNSSHSNNNSSVSITGHHDNCSGHSHNDFGANISVDHGNGLTTNFNGSTGSNGTSGSVTFNYNY